MVKSVLGISHQGLNDWKIQRLSAIFIAVFSLVVIGFLVGHPNLSYPAWREFFAYPLMKIAAILFLLAILYHAWIGMWTVYTDYIKNFIVRSFFDTLTLLIFFAFFIWGILILWSV